MFETSERLRECFVAVFPELSAHEIPLASQASLASWDSLASVNLASVVEEEFGITISTEEFGELTSFPSILELIQSKVAHG